MIEVHLKAGVMDPVADSCEMAIKDLLNSKFGIQNSELLREGGGGGAGRKG